MQDLPPGPRSANATHAFTLLSALDAYDTACSKLVDHWPDADLHAHAIQKLAPIRQIGSALAPVTVMSLQLAIAHAELISLLWETASGKVTASRAQEAQQRHAAAIRALRSACETLLGKH